MATVKVLVGMAALLALAGCDAGGKTDERSAVIEACNTQQGAGWYRKEYGENYCECYADAAKEKMDKVSYETLAAASREELKARDDKGAREAIARRNTQVYSEASRHAQSCKKK